MNFLQKLLGQNLPANRKRGGNPIDILLNRRPEDASFVGGQQGYVRQNADVAHFPMQPQGLPEDAGYMNGPQGPVPMNMDVAHFQNPQIQQPNWQQRRVMGGVQGGNYNPGQIPLQQSNIRYRQGPQPTQPWYDF